MSDGEGLLAAILANPDEDVPRLVYADWLQENGRPERAEFIRVQVEVARVEPFTPRAYELVRREAELWAEAGNYDPALWWMRDPWRWLGIPAGCHWFIDIIVHEALTPSGDGGNRILVGRGFVEEVTCTAGDWLAHGDALRAAHPVRKVTLTTWRASEVLDRWTETRARFVPKRYCRFKGRDRLHVLPLVDATPDDYRRVCEDEWPGVAFTLPSLPAGTGGHLIPVAEAVPLGSWSMAQPPG
jgi:uncharacterized protein (TIGR02996 family)